MNPVLLAATSVLADAAPDTAAVSSAATRQEGQPFSLLQMATENVAARLQSARHSQRQASDAQRQESDPAAMQALMAMLLAQPAPALPANTAQQPAAGLPEKLAALHSASVLSSLARRDEPQQALAQTHSPALSPAAQGLLASLRQANPQGQEQATPAQQAALARFSAEDLRAIAPEPPTPPVAQRAEARVKQSAHGVVRPQAAVKRVVTQAQEQPAETQNLLNVTAQVSQPASPLNGHNVVAAHAASPTVMSADELGEKLTALLKDRIQFQLGQQQQTSTIRLDPPSLGKLEIAVQLDAGKLTVHIGASQSDVCRSLQQFSEDLRLHLTAQNFMEVNVQVSSEGGQQQQQQSGRQQEEVMSALMLGDEPQYQQKESVLIKV